MADVDLTAVVEKQLTAQAAKKTTDITQSDVAKVSPGVSAAVNKEVNALVTNLTNQEPWYQSRIIIGTVVAAGLQIASIVGVKTDFIDPTETTNLLLQLGTLAGALFAWYGRTWGSTQPPLGQ